MMQGWVCWRCPSRWLEARTLAQVTHREVSAVEDPHPLVAEAVLSQRGVQGHPATAHCSAGDSPAP